MVAHITRALASGYPSRVILNEIIKKYPQHASKIMAAEAAGYGTDQILKHISGERVNDESDDYLTEHEQVQKRDSKQKRDAALQAIGAIGVSGAVAAGAYGYATRNNAVRPSQILPAQGQAQQRQLPPPQNGGSIGYQPRPRQPNQPQGPQPTHPQQPQPQGRQPTPNVPQQTHDPEKNISVVKNIKEDTRIENILKNTPQAALAAQILRKVMSPSKVAILDKAPGGLEQVVQDYSQYLQSNPPAVREQFQPRQVQQSSQDLSIQSAEENLQQPIQPEQEIPQQEMAAQEQPETPIEERISETVKGAELGKHQEEKQLREQSFSIPNYQYPGEDPKEFADRKILYSVVNKGAKALLEGKSFLDFPVNKDAIKARGGYSVAADVLRFMGGIPNVYDELLDDEDRSELMNALLESGKLSVPGLAPTPGERSIHGERLAPNLVWNLLLAVEPRLATMEKPPSIKGYQMAPGKKMGTAELRKFLTRSVYGVLSGKTISSELSDKISRISKATSHLDAIVKAVKDGNIRKMDEEMERLMDDDYFMEIMSKDIDDLIMTADQKEAAEKLEKEDKKYMASLKAKETREKKKVAIGNR